MFHILHIYPYYNYLLYNNYRLYQQIIWVPMMCPVFINPSCVCALFCLFHKHKKYNTHFNFWNILSLCLLHIRKKTQSNMQSMVNSKARVSEVLSARSTSHFYSFIITQYNQNVAKGVRDPCLECFHPSLFIKGFFLIWNAHN